MSLRGRGLLGAVGFLCPDVEKRGLLCSVFSQFSIFVYAADNGLFLFSLVPALYFVPLSLLACVFLLALGKC